MKKVILGIIFVVGIGAFLLPKRIWANLNNVGEARVYVFSSNKAIEKLVGVNHRFPKGVFSTQASPQVRVLESLGLIKTAPVAVYHVSPGKPTHPGKPSKNERTCFPQNQKPWGIEKVRGGNDSEGAGRTVAVLDTGVDKGHLDLKDNISFCKDTTKRGIKDGCKDGNGHGTHVAGTIAANGGADGQGIYGVAPEAKIMAIKVCGNSGTCWGDDVAAGIYYAAENGANIISLSLGGNTPDPQILSAVDYAATNNTLVIAAAGNDGPERGSIDYPAAYQKVVAVAAFDSSNQISDWSSQGVNNNDWQIEEREVEFAAPGVDIESTWNDGCYQVLLGTSMATPHISGIAARDWQGSANATRTYLENLARNYTENVYDYGEQGDDPAAGFGLPVQ